MAPLLDAPSEQVQLWYKTFPTDHDGRMEMKFVCLFVFEKPN
jgi:hypothetical protein